MNVTNAQIDLEAMRLLRYVSACRKGKGKGKRKKGWDRALSLLEAYVDMRGFTVPEATAVFSEVVRRFAKRYTTWRTKKVPPWTEILISAMEYIADGTRTGTDTYR